MENGKYFIKEVVDFSIREISTNEIVLVFICDTKHHAEELLLDLNKNEIIYLYMTIDNDKVSFIIRQSEQKDIEMVYETGYKYSEYKPFKWILENKVRFLSTGYYSDCQNELNIISNYIHLSLRIK